MFHRVSRIILSLLVILYNYRVTVCTSLARENEKLPDNSALQMCIDSFDIYKDKIIKTEDSQGLGAKYLKEFDLDSRQDCLRLCCQTDECDVFIFEEKKPGSCYLFHCGRLHDFKCKFTSHANYSSAVLVNFNYRGTTQLEEQIRRTQQEHELKSLRKLAEPPPQEYAYTEAPPILVTEAPKNPPTTAAPVKTGCSRNQYECRTSGDCIAIYNVCDGIPQCADGSDEASYLGCPTEKPTLAPLPIIHEPPVAQTSHEVLAKYPQNVPHRTNNPTVYGNEADGRRKMWQVPVLPHQTNQQQTNVQYPGPQGIMSIPQMNYGSQGYVNGWDYRQMYQQNKDNFLPNQQIHAQSEYQPYEQDQSHIFKHKAPGVVAESAGLEMSPYMENNRAYAPYYPVQNHATWQEGQAQGQQAPSQRPEPTVTPVPKLQQSRPVVVQEEQKSTVGPESCKPSPKETSAPVSTEVKHVEEKEHKSQKKVVEKTKALEPETKPESHESVHEPKVEAKVEKAQVVNEEHQKSHEEQKTEVRKHHFVAERLQQNNHHLLDNDALKPKGAVISLALGLTATAIMAALIACRLRVVRRRGRRGHGPYAHDADYLVNGMYL